MKTKLSILLIVLVGLCAGPASASEIVDRNTSKVTLKVNNKGEALIQYKKAGAQKNVLVWGAINASHPNASAKQLKFRFDYAGGWGKYKKLLYKPGNFTNSCKPYSGPKLDWFVTGCTAADGSHWALQSWQRMLPNLGFVPWKAEQAVWELHLSHFNTELPQLEGYMNWAYSKGFRHFFGRYTYLGQPVFGFKTTSTGSPLDTWGRNIYLDVLNPVNYPVKGWTRENSFTAHTGSGVFCYGFYPHPPYGGYPEQGTVRGEGFGESYRATVIGPGVMPDVTWSGTDPGPFDKADSIKLALETEMDALQKSFGDKLCKIG